MDDQRASELGAEARALVENPVFKKLFLNLREMLEQKRLNLKPTDTDACADAIRVEQLLTQLETIVVEYIESGKLADFRLKQSLKDKLRVWR